METKEAHPFSKCLHAYTDAKSSDGSKCVSEINIGGKILTYSTKSDCGHFAKVANVFAPPKKLLCRIELLRRIKVLPIDCYKGFLSKTYMPREYFVDQLGCIEKEAVVGKNGWYYDRVTKNCWYEFDGKSYFRNKDGETFLHRLKSKSLPRLTDEELKSLSVALKIKWLSGKVKKELWELCFFERHNRELRKISLDARRIMHRVLRK